MRCCLAAAAINATSARGLDKTVTIAPGVDMPTINLGTNGRNDPTLDIPVWFSHGGTGIDTADMYGSQPVIAPQIKNVPRDSFFITSKIPVGPFVQDTCTSPDASLIQKTAHKIIDELGLEYVDLMLLHFPCDDDEVNRMYWKSMMEIRAMNLTRAIGVSNYNAAQLRGLGSDVATPAVNQCQMHIAGHDDATIEYCKDKGIQYESYYALHGCPLDDDRVTSIATSHNVSTAQVCLRYVLEKGVVIAAGTGKDSSKVEEYTKSDFGIYDFVFTEEEFQTLDGIAPKTIV